jgi:hypothetical protein
VTQHQERIAGGKRHRLARFERHALSSERVGGDGLVQIRVGLGRERKQDDGGVVVGVLIAEETLARHHTRRRREPDARARRIVGVGGGREGGAKREREDGEEPQDHGGRHHTAIERRKIRQSRRPFRKSVIDAGSREALS